MAVKTIQWKNAEAREETGTGVVLKIDHTPGQLDAQVTWRATHWAKLVEPITCWVATNEEAFARAQWGLENRAELWYRIVVHRKKSADQTVPLEDVPKREKVRDLVQVERAANDPMNQTRPAVAGSNRAAVAAPPQRALESAPGTVEQLPAGTPAEEIVDADIVEPPAVGLPPDGTFETPGPTPVEGDVHTQENVLQMRALRIALQNGDMKLAQVHEDALLAGGVSLEEIARATNRRLDAVAAGTTPGGGDSVREGPRAAAEAFRRAADPGEIRSNQPPVPDLDPEAAVPATPGPAVSPVSGLSRRGGAQPIASDSKPWEYYNTDGLPNLSSYAAGATMDFVNLAGRLIVTRLRQRAAEDPTYVIEAPTPVAVRTLAATLLHMADLAQSSLHEGAKRDRMASSYRLARQSVRESIDLFPVPWGEPPEVREAWKVAVVKHASVLMGVTWKLLAP